MFLDNSGDVFSEEGDNFQSFVMFFQSLDEKFVSIASLFSQIFFSLDDGGSSLVNPDQVLIGNFDFVFNMFSVGGGLISGSLVFVSDCF